MARKMLIDGSDDGALQSPDGYEYDLFTIGAGSGGVRASRMSSGHGAKASIYYRD